ncbi:MAG TPA: penicillin acylase family protein, partial [Flavihumibacter sp.]|nr:penicillin acylase family protein [Flavihumibacter sp.]
GQSGNPGSRFYDNSISDWAAGKYYRLWLMKEAEKEDERVRWVMHFRKA